MCGIAGFAGFHAVTPECRVRLGAMLAALHHRGPDDEGTWFTTDVALGHRRLSIVDLRTGRQPIGNEDGRVRVVTNGEIYNHVVLRDELTARGHRFSTSSDAEVIVHLYEELGDAFVERLNGMFAIALWDDRRRRLILARDRLGVKPLYYAVDADRLVFGSELKAVLGGMRRASEIDATALAEFLAYGFIPSPKTIFQNVRKLEPGQSLVFERDAIRLRRHWKLQYRGINEASNDDELAAQTWRELKRATRLRWAADVPVGAFLSGGVDSAAVVGAMAQTSTSRISTVTCGFEESRFDERTAARDTAQLLDTNHHEPVARCNLGGMADRLAWHFDEPFADASAIPMFLLSEHARRYMTVALSGDGGDEILAGYRRYRFDVAEQAARRWIPHALRRGALPAIAGRWPAGPRVPRMLRAAATLRNIATDPATAHAHSIATLRASDAIGLMQPDLAASLDGFDPLHVARKLYGECDSPDHLSKCQYVDIRLGLADGILTKVDRASMAHGLEVRSPLLDWEFVEFAWTIPPHRRRRGAHGKLPLRRAVMRHVDPRVAARKKAGFDVPMDAWFRAPKAVPLLQSVLTDASGAGEYLSRSAMSRVVDAHRAGRADCGATIWKFVVLHAWARRFAGRASGGAWEQSAA